MQPRSRAIAGEALTNRASRAVVSLTLAIDEACRLMTADFEEMPDLCVTTRQAARFWGLEEQVASEALSGMAQRKYLRCARGVFRRA
jgi:hypothetical protein